MQPLGDVTGSIQIGNPRELTVFEVAEHDVEWTRSTSSLEFRLLLVHDPKQPQPSIDADNAVLGRQSRSPLREGLDCTVGDL